ncbi:hypothetical protein OHAE_1357 [Ochrobactrum soli]|uniref:Uncharacterized protein n=1 Tax=Ochrobactrum soli TaxID=2448455 RepID=A0A2P9HNS8_9HYPH|nr:hypothetical protein OHAE_1357 [[Ochrobactrum] soli]
MKWHFEQFPIAFRQNVSIHYFATSFGGIACEFHNNYTQNYYATHLAFG